MHRNLPNLVRRLAPGLAVAVVAAGVHAPSLANGLTNWDDGSYVAANPIAAAGLAGIPAAFTSAFDGAWYPLTQTTYCLVQAVAGPSPFAHHLIQWLLFAVTVGLVPAALAAFGVPMLPAAAAALLWAVHPFRVESVAWAANLKDAIMALGVVAAFALWPRRADAAAEPAAPDGARRRARWPSVVAFAVALLGKSMAFPVAILFALLAWSEGDGPLRALRRAAPYLVAGAAVALISGTLHVESATDARSYPGGSFIGALPSAAWLPWWYLGRTLVPFASRAVYAFEPVGWLDPRLGVAIGLWAVTAGWITTRGAAARRWLVLAAAYALPFATVIGLVPMRFHIAERYTLLPSLAVAAALAVGAARLLQRTTSPRAVAGVALAAVALPLCAGTVLREREWRSGVALWEANRPLAPEVYAVRFNLAGAYGGEGRWAEAIAELREARRVAPQEQRLLGDLLFAMAAQTKIPVDRLLQWSQSLLRAGNSDVAVASVASQLVDAGEPGVAMAFLDESHLDDSARVLSARARASLAQGRAADALAFARRAQAADPAFLEPRIDALLALMQMGDYEQVVEQSQVPLEDLKLDVVRRRARELALSRLGREAER